MRGSIRTRTATVFQTIALIVLLVYMNACFTKPDIPTASTNDFENPNPLHISKEEANNIKVVAITMFPLVNTMSPPMPMMGMVAMPTTTNPVALLTDTINNKRRFHVISSNEFRKN
jgi:hypothetical protein